jgi:hypothetical protein
MIEQIAHKIKRIFSEKNGQIYKLRPITSSFVNIAHYSLDNNTSARIYTKNIIAHKFKNTINFKKEDLYNVVTTTRKIEKTLTFNQNEVKDIGRESLLQNGIKLLQEKISEDLDKESLFLMSEMGRITASGYGQIKQNIGNFTISKDTNGDAILYRLASCDSALKELNNIGLKHIILSQFIFDKIKDSIKEDYIVVNHKQIKYQLLSEYLDTDSLCLIASSQVVEESTPGIVMVYNTMTMEISEKTDDLSIALSQEYAIDKVGSRPEFYYIRFLQT